MAHPLEKTVHDLARRGRRLLLAFALWRFLAAVVAVVALLALADYAIRFDDRGVRAICTLVVLAVGVIAARRYLWSAWRRRLSDVDVAQRIERSFPVLGDRLSSSLEFLKQSEDDPLAGSAALRRAVVADTTDAVSRLELHRAIDPRPTRRALALAAAMALVVAALVAIDAASARLALVRLVNPLSDAAWPKATQLVFRESPERVALGQTFEVEVVDALGRRLPDEVRIHYRYEDDEGQTSEEVEAMQWVNGAMIARKENVARPFAYRAEGGDDRAMPWTALEVVEPPAIERATVQLEFPAYTGWAARESEPQIRAIVGTRAVATGRVNKPLRLAAIGIDGGERIAGQVDSTGFQFAAPAAGATAWTIEKSGSYRFVLEDLEGFPGGQDTAYEVRAIPDLPPTVELEQPKSNIFATAQASIPLRMALKDDLAVQRVELVYLRSDRSDQGDVALTLVEGPPQVPPELATASAVENPPGDQRVLDHRWDLAALDLKPGVQLTFHATATDYLPQTGRSAPRRLTIITAEELNERLADRQSFVLGELARVLKLQQESRAQVSALELQIERVGRLNKPDVDTLQAARLTQQQVERELAGESEGVPAQVRNLLADLENNKVDSPDVVRQMQGILAELKRLGEDELPRTARGLTDALKEAQKDGANAAVEKAAVAAPLAGAGQAQDAVVESLERLLGSLSQWDTYRRFRVDVNQLRQEQEQLGEQTTAVGRETLTKDARDLTPQQQADLAKLAQQQGELARRLDRVQERMRQMANQLRDKDPLAADNVADALEHAQDQAIGAQMREASRNVESNQMGQAVERQARVVEQLKDLSDILANRREHELSRLVKKLREAEQKLGELANQQQGLKKQLRDAEKLSDPDERRRELERLTKEQRRVQEEAERLARSLERLQAERSSRTTAHAGAKMKQAGDRGAQQDAGAAADAAEQAERDLAEAQQQLAQERRQAEIDLATEQLAQMETALASMKDRQAKLLEETKHYDALRKEHDRFTRAAAASVRELGRQEADLQAETEALAQSFEAAQVFQYVLDAAARDMKLAAGLLDERETGDVTQRAVRSGLDRISQLLESLKNESQPQPADQPEGGEGGEGGGQDGQQVRSIAELRLLKLVQQQVLERTRALEESRAGRGALTEPQQREYQLLAEEQGRLADMLLDMVQPEEPKPEEEGESP